VLREELQGALPGHAEQGSDGSRAAHGMKDGKEDFGKTRCASIAA
jgi:hypothetical protein